MCIIKGIEATLLHTLHVATRGQAQPCLTWFHANLNQAMCFEGNRMATIYAFVSSRYIDKCIYLIWIHSLLFSAKTSTYAEQYALGENIIAKHFYI